MESFQIAIALLYLSYQLQCELDFHPFVSSQPPAGNGHFTREKRFILKHRKSEPVELCGFAGHKGSRNSSNHPEAEKELSPGDNGA